MWLISLSYRSTASLPWLPYAGSWLVKLNGLNDFNGSKNSELNRVRHIVTSFGAVPTILIAIIATCLRHLSPQHGRGRGGQSLGSAAVEARDLGAVGRHRVGVGVLLLEGEGGAAGARHPRARLHAPGGAVDRRVDLRLSAPEAERAAESARPLQLLQWRVKSLAVYRKNAELMNTYISIYLFF